MGKTMKGTNVAYTVGAVLLLAADRSVVDSNKISSAKIRIPVFFIIPPFQLFILNWLPIYQNSQMETRFLLNFSLTKTDNTITLICLGLLLPVTIKEFSSKNNDS